MQPVPCSCIVRARTLRSFIQTTAFSTPAFASAIPVDSDNIIIGGLRIFCKKHAEFETMVKHNIYCNHWHGPTAESVALDNDVVSGLLTEALFGTFCVRYRGTR